MPRTKGYGTTDDMLILRCASLEITNTPARRQRSQGKIICSWSMYAQKGNEAHVNRTQLERRNPHPGPLPSDGRGRIVGSRFGNRTLVRGSWSRCIREGERGLSMNRERSEE